MSSDGTIYHSGGRVGFLLLHGLGGGPIELQYVARGLSQAGHTVLCPVLAGHGTTQGDLNASDRFDWYKSVEQAHARLRKECDIVIAGGLSMGAVLALQLAARKPETVNGLSLYSPTIWPNGWAIPWYFALFKLVQQKALANRFHFSECAPYGIKDERIRNFVLRSLLTDNKTLDDVFGRSGGLVWEFKHLVREVRELLPMVRQRTLILHPRDDDQSDLSNANLLVRKLAGRVELCVLEDSYHIITVDRQRQVVIDKSAALAAELLRDAAQDTRTESATELPPAQTRANKTITKTTAA